MGNQLRYRSGQVQLIKVRVDSGTVIEAGDLVFLDEDDVKPASAFSWDTNLATTQASFAALFLGVAHQCSGNGDTEPISVDVSPHAVYEFDVAATTYEVGICWDRTRIRRRSVIRNSKEWGVMVLPSRGRWNIGRRAVVCCA